MLKLASIFVAIFLAELGDKTQIATLMFATDRAVSPFLVFLAAAGALTLSSGIAVLIGSQAAALVEALPLKLIAGIAFLAIGVWSIAEHVLGR